DRFDFAIFSLTAIFVIPVCALGATVILRLVRRVNRHDDPRCSKRQADTLATSPNGNAPRLRFVGRLKGSSPGWKVAFWFACASAAAICFIGVPAVIILI